MADQPPVTNGTCDSCGREDEEVTEVVRVYVVPESWDRERQVTEAEGTEQWCFPCLTHYPHRVVGEDPAETAADEGQAPT
jgi:hypothetical protein